MKANDICLQDCIFLVSILNVTFSLSSHDPVCYFCIIPAAGKTEKHVVILSLNMVILFLPHTAVNPIICRHLSVIHVFLFSQCFVQVGNTIEGQLK